MANATWVSSGRAAQAGTPHAKPQDMWMEEQQLGCPQETNPSANVSSEHQRVSAVGLWSSGQSSFTSKQMAVAICQ